MSQSINLPDYFTVSQSLHKYAGPQGKLAALSKLVSGFPAELQVGELWPAQFLGMLLGYAQFTLNEAAMKEAAYKRAGAALVSSLGPTGIQHSHSQNGKRFTTE